MSPNPTEIVLMRIRPALPDPEDKTGNRGPILMEPAISAMHYLKGADGIVGLEIGFYQGKVCFFARCTRAAAGLIESQLYAQYPDIDIEPVPADIFEPKAGESVFFTDLEFTDPEVYPIKRHPQFDDLLSRQTIDPIASMTSILLRYPDAHMRGHIQLVFQPFDGTKRKFRTRTLKFLPLLSKGFSAKWSWYGKLFCRVHLARGWRWWAFLPLNIVMGGFRAWFSFVPNLSDIMLSEDGGAASSDAEDYAQEYTTKRNHDSETSLGAIADKVNHLLFVGNVRLSIVAKTETRPSAEAKLHEIQSSFRQFSLPHLNGFKEGVIKSSQSFPTGFQRNPYLLSAEEIATLWHPPSLLVRTPNIDWVVSKKLQPPVDLPTVEDEDAASLTVLGEAVFRGHRTQFGIRPDDRRRHMYIIGKTGMGKSTLLENMIYSDVLAGKGVGVIDPHGDLIEACLKFIPANRTNDVVLFSPADKDFPLSFNMLSCPNPDQYPLVASGLMSVFTKLWPDVWSGRMEHILRNALLALIETQGNSMLGILRMFADDVFRRKTVEHVRDHLVKSFWQDEYEGWTEKYRTEAIAAIQNKIGQLLSVPIIRNIVGQVNSKLNVREAMDSGKIVLVNLSKGNLGEDNSAFLGSMLVTKFQLDAMSRADIPEKDRKDFYLYVDEFQNFATESFATILSEARKYRLALTLANQYIGQLTIGDNSTALRDAVFGNVGSMVSFQVGAEDAEELALQFEEMIEPKDILSLPKYHAYMRLMINGMPSKPFSVSTLPPPKLDQDPKRVDIIRRMSRERYAEKRSVVEEKIGRWLQSANENRKLAVSDAKMKEKEVEERDKAKKKGMTLEAYRAWRDREMWTNDFNALRKKALSEPLSQEEKGKMADLEQKLKNSGGVPPPSKAMQEAAAKKSGVPAAAIPAVTQAPVQSKPQNSGAKPKKPQQGAK